ncbi:putative protein kinase [Blattamonas nauphoetae]|uniref:Uncharacterized protein n=1 Tax=Blattamonas nauphoetae TaxID=2049346 RepID=A0ABQ9XKQ0_9EUKA|nr:putative protein kinase [Blattamonas nauphoetae]
MDIVLCRDDTLLPSSLIFHTLADENSLILTEEHVPSFLELDEAVISLLKMALLYTSNVFIVTNAEVGWVERSSKLYLPRTCELLNSIRVISARTRYEKKHPGKPNIWKELVFRETLHDDLLFGQVPIKLNLVSLGDSECERIALQSMEGHFPSRTIVKSIKYVDAPTIDQLCKEHQVILSNFDFICTSPTNLDLALQMYHTDKQAQQETINTKRKYCHHQKHDGKDGKSPTKQASCEHFPDVSAPHEHVPMIRQEGLSPEDSEDEQ